MRILSANSGNNALSRSPEFTAEFLARHQDKLIFGSDCNCLDGNGKGQPSATDPARDAPNGVAARLTGNCTARTRWRSCRSRRARRCSERSPGTMEPGS